MRLCSARRVDFLIPLCVFTGAQRSVLNWFLSAYWVESKSRIQRRRFNRKLPLVFDLTQFFEERELGCIPGEQVYLSFSIKPQSHRQSSFWHLRFSTVNQVELVWAHPIFTLVVVPRQPSVYVHCHSSGCASRLDVSVPFSGRLLCLGS